jgi:small subunit ribosomal protein S8
MTDTIADMIIRIKNAYMARHKQVVMPASMLRENIAKILVETGYVESFVRQEQAPQDELSLVLRYINGKPALTDLERISKPGRRVYATSENLPKVLAGYGTAVISTSSGVMTSQQAKEKHIGGEILFKVW